MAFHAIAFGPDEHVLLTIDARELLAHDAQTESPKWRLTFDHPLVGVLFAEAGALPGSDGASPWRAPSSGRCILAVDAEGGLHAIEPLLGDKLSTLGPFGKPTGVAAGPGGVVALALEDKVLLWRNRERTEIPGRASAIAFSNDGGTLAIGAPDGGLRFMSVGTSAAPVETFCAVVHGGIADVVQHPGGTWIAAGKTGISTVSSAGAQRLDGVAAGVMRVALDRKGKRLAVQLSERALAIYAWPALECELRIEYMERLVGGASFGSGDWLGIALDHGDGNKIDVVTSATHRTDTHPGRTHRSWLLSVRGKEAVLSAKEADDIRRMKDPFHTPAPDRSSGNGKGARVGIGVAVALGLFCLRLCAAGSRHSSSYSSGAYDPYIPPTATATATAAKNARAIKHVALVRLEGPARLATTEEIPSANLGESEEPGSIWTAPDGTVFVATMNAAHDRSHVHRRDTAGSWDVITRRRSSTLARLWGRSATDLYVMDHDSLGHFDGLRMTEVPPPAPRTIALGGVGDDVFVAGLSAGTDDDAPSRVALHRRQASTKKWAPEATGEGLAVNALWPGGGTLWARALGKDGEDGADDLLLQRSTSGRWTERRWFGATRPKSAAIRSVWVSPTGDAFVATDAGVFRSANAGASWSKTAGEATSVRALWGRSNADVYAATDDGVLQFDGKVWSPTSYTERVSAIGGTATDVLLAVAAD